MIGQENGAGMAARHFVVSGHRIEADPLSPGLYPVATPIGNLSDITLRALHVLAGADVVLCEDTRHSAHLLQHYGIKTPREAMHEHNERQKLGQVLERLEKGEAVALISDAGTPLISDPGFQLARAARASGHTPKPVPGASALLSALVLSGLPTDRFCFLGFLPSKASARTRELEAIQDHSQTLVFYESPRRLGASLGAMRDVLGGTRQAVVALELTKRFERSHADSLQALAELFDGPAPKGEAVIVVEGAQLRAPDPKIWLGQLHQLLETKPLRSAVDEIAAIHNLPRKQVYEAALVHKKNQT